MSLAQRQLLAGVGTAMVGQGQRCRAPRSLAAVPRRRAPKDRAGKAAHLHLPTDIDYIHAYHRIIGFFERGDAHGVPVRRIGVRLGARSWAGDLLEDQDITNQRAAARR